MMRAIAGSNTRPERTVRRYIHAVGLRFRLHDPALPGKPDLSFNGRKVAVFVHGCFWHQHPGCAFAARPATRVEFWQAKFAANYARDIAVAQNLKVRGWRVLTIWECQTTNELSLDELAWSILAA
jgi:DNA mismatch endonuclease, patch repair protein